MSELAKKSPVQSCEKVPNQSVKNVSVQFGTKDLVHPGLNAELTKTANHVAPIPPSPSPGPPHPLEEQARTWIREFDTTVKAQGPAKPKQKKINDFFKTLNRGPHTCTTAAITSSTLSGNSQEVEVVEVVK